MGMTHMIVIRTLCTFLYITEYNMSSDTLHFLSTLPIISVLLLLCYNTQKCQ